jgi:hypothetical protein
MNRLKLLSLLLMVALASNTLAYGIEFQDMDRHEWAVEAVEVLSSQGFIKGYAGELFEPSNPLSRAELVTLINRMNGWTEKAEIPFVDVSSQHWAYKEIGTAYQVGYITGFPDQTFRPDLPVTRAQFAVVLCRLYGLNKLEIEVNITDKMNIDSWALTSIEAIVGHGLMKGYEDGSFQSNRPMSRAETAVALHRVLLSGLRLELDFDPNQEDIGTLSEEETLLLLKSVLGKMRVRVLPILQTELQKSALQTIMDSIQAYVLDTEYDISSDVEKAKNQASIMDENEKKEFKNAISGNIPLAELVELNKKFLLFDY